MSSKDIIFVAAENGALPGAKVGGVGDVIRDLPAAVNSLGWPATVLTPAYGILHKLDGAVRLEPLETRFRGKRRTVDVYAVPGSRGGVRYLVFDHPLFMPTQPGIVYHEDEDGRPYATDSDKFAFFSAAVAAWIDTLDTPPATIHLHDWHVGTLAALREYDPTYKLLKQTRIVFTIHNLSYQGQRPFGADPSSFDAWFPDMDYEPATLSDPDNKTCYNPMAAAIRLSDCVSTVSPRYAEEILKRSDPDKGFVGGEGLETTLAGAASDGKLSGILNGCDYSGAPATPPGWQTLLTLAQETLEKWHSRNADRVHELGLQRLADFPRRRPLHVLTSVGRVVAQKTRLFLEPTDSGKTSLDEILDELGDSGVLLLLGSGEARFEKQLIDIAERHDNLIYFCGYSESLGYALYSAGDLFLMPSSFEPCGISQMLAMRDGQPCVVHGVGGLYDTIEDGSNGFIFGGDSPQAQAQNFVASVVEALVLRRDDPLRWQSIRKNALAERFDWETSARQYIANLYEHP